MARRKVLGRSKNRVFYKLLCNMLLRRLEGWPAPQSSMVWIRLSGCCDARQSALHRSERGKISTTKQTCSPSNRDLIRDSVPKFRQLCIRELPVSCYRSLKGLLARHKRVRLQCPVDANPIVVCNKSRKQFLTCHVNNRRVHYAETLLMRFRIRSGVSRKNGTVPYSAVGPISAA